MSSRLTINASTNPPPNKGESATAQKSLPQLAQPALSNERRDPMARRKSDPGTSPTRANHTDPTAKAKDDDLPIATRKETRSKTHTFSKEHAHNKECNLTPEGLSNLHAVHEKFRNKDATATDSVDILCDEFWGTNGSWHAYANLPSTRETPMAHRTLAMIPSIPTVQLESLLEQWGVASINTKGRKGNNDRSVGQDNLSFSRLSSGWECICVADGHGPLGDWPATRAVRTLPCFLQGDSCSKMLRHQQVGAAIKHGFDLVQKDLVARSRAENIELQVSGTTFTCALYHPTEMPGRVWLGTSGDSRAILVAPGRGVLEATEDHKPLLPIEKKRLEESGCEIIVRSHANGFQEIRVFIKGEDYPGLCMSRSLGDLIVKDNGVIAEPEVVEWAVQGDALLLLASDGVWEFLENEQVAEIILNSNEGSLAKRLETLLVRSKASWAQNEGSYCDDITMVLRPFTSEAPRYEAPEPQVNGMCAGKCEGCTLM